MSNIFQDDFYPDNEGIELAPEFVEVGWDTWDLPDAFDIIGDALDYMDEQGYM